MRPERIGRSALLFSAMLSAAWSPCCAAALSAAVDQLPPDVETRFNAGQYHQAIEALQTAVKRNPTDASLEYWLGRSFFEIHDFTQSISSFEQAVKLDPNRSEYHDWLGRACGRKADESSHSNMPAALRLARRTHHEFEVAVQLNAANIQARRDLISFIANAPRDLGGGEEEALEQINALSVVDPVEGTLALADLYAVQKKFAQANEEYQKVLTSARNRVDAFLEAADYYRDRGDSEHMEQAVQAAEKSASSDRRLSYYRGVVLVLEKGNPETAEKDLRAYIDDVPENSEIPSHSSAREWLGKLYENEKRLDLAVQEYQTALALDPKNKALREALKRLQHR